MDGSLIHTALTKAHVHLKLFCYSSCNEDLHLANMCICFKSKCISSIYLFEHS